MGVSLMYLKGETPFIDVIAKIQSISINIAGNSSWIRAGAAIGEVLPQDCREKPDSWISCRCLHKITH